MNISRYQIESCFFGNPQLIAARILFIKRAARLEEYKQHLLEVQEFGEVWHGLTGLLRGEMVTIIATGIGPSLVGDAIYALDSPDSICLYSGTCGGLYEGLEIGDYFIADQAVCGEGYATHFRHALWTEVAGDDRTLESLTAQIATRVTRAERGLTFTTSSVVREADIDFWGSVSDRCRIIDMAAAAFYAAAATTGKRAAAYFWVTDLPTRGKSFFETLTPEDIRIKQDRYDRSVTLDLELLASI